MAALPCRKSCWLSVYVSRSWFSGRYGEISATAWKAATTRASLKQRLPSRYSIRPARPPMKLGARFMKTISAMVHSLPEALAKGITPSSRIVPASFRSPSQVAGTLRCSRLKRSRL